MWHGKPTQWAVEWDDPAEYIQGFCQLASHLGNWPERVLIIHFQEGLRKKVYHTCLSWGMPQTLQAWYCLTSEVEIDLSEFHEHVE